MSDKHNKKKNGFKEEKKAHERSSECHLRRDAFRESNEFKNL